MTRSKQTARKRLRTAPTAAVGSNVLSLADLPNDQLVAIADYLPKTSRALFAVALTAPPSSFRATNWRCDINDASKAIIESTKSLQLKYSPISVNNYTYVSDDMKKYYAAQRPWEMLSFVDVPTDMKGKLNDDTLGAILVCIGAKSSLKKLSISGCNRAVVGHGLEPLRGSIVLESINFGNITFYSGRNQQSPLSEASVIPILESIIETDGNALREISLPTEWRKGQSRNEEPLSSFCSKFNRMMLGKEVKCLSCDQLVAGNAENTCQVCSKRICSTCNSINDHGYYESSTHNESVAPISSCNHCNQKLCQQCGEHRHCSKCNSVHCSLCAKEDGVDAGRYCEGDYCENESCCAACRVPEECGECWSCRELVFAKLLTQKQTLEEVNREVLEENERLAKENRQLHMTVDELQKKQSNSQSK